MALPLLEEAEERFAADGSIPERLKRRIRGEALLIHMLLVFNDLRAMRDIFTAAHELLGGRSAIVTRHLTWNFACPHSAFTYLREPGTYRDIVEVVEGNMHYYQDLSDGCSRGVEPLFRAEYLLERSEFTSANANVGLAREVEAHLRAAVFQARTKDQITTILSAAFCLSRLRAVTGRPEEALAALREHEQEAGTWGHADLFTCLDLAIGYIAACLRLYEAIPQWLREGDFNPVRNPFQTNGFIMSVHGKAVLLSGDYVRLEAVAKSIPETIGAYNNVFARIHGKVLESLAAKYLYGLDKAMPLLEEALGLARPDNILLSIAEYGGYVLPLMRALRERDAYLAALIRMAERYPRAPKKPGHARLTRREEEILRLAAQGMRNADIAKALNLSPETIKKELSAGYRRLGAANRAEAVRRFMQIYPFG